MRIETPRALIEAIEAEIRPAGVSLARQVEALRELHALFTTRRAAVRGTSYLDVPRLRNAYLRYHLPLNVARATYVLRKLLELGIDLGALEDVVDLGAGPGSASIATVFEAPARSPRTLELHDRSRAALAAARRILSHVSASGTAPPPGIAAVRTEVGLLSRLPRIRGPALIWLSTVLNELGMGLRGGPEPEDVARGLSIAVEPGSIVIILEPALRAPSRSLLRLHDAALASGSWTVLAPCTHQRACPLLREHDRPWCHFDLEWRAPDLVRRVAAPLGLDTERAFVSYLALRRGPPSRKDGASSMARAIGDPMAVRGARRGVYICVDGRREVLVDPPAGARRGDLLPAAAP